MKKAIFFVIILIIIFFIFYYNASKIGHNIIIKDENKIVDYVLNIREYEAEIEVEINSNKTENIYKMKQIEKENYSLLEVLSSGKIKGLKIEYKDGVLNVKNTELKLDKIYENYEPIMKNSLFLKTFITEFKENDSTTYQENDQIILETKVNAGNSYNVYKKLYVDTKTVKPVKLEIKDNTKKTTICIKYNNIEIK